MKSATNLWDSRRCATVPVAAAAAGSTDASTVNVMLRDPKEAVECHLLLATPMCYTCCTDRISQLSTQLKRLRSMPQHLRGLAVLSAVFACLCYLLSLSVHPVAEKEAPTCFPESIQLTSQDSAWQNDDLPLLNRQRRDTCGSLDCMNGGTCNTTGPTPVCSCPKPYSGTNCSDVDNYCEKVQPEKGINNLPICLNGGGCTPRNWDPYFDCTCIINSTGIRCETFVACFYHNPCVNGLCINTASAPNCSCFAGWTDAQCSTDVDDCHSRPCQNGGICIDGNSTFTCDCTSTDYSGATCSDRINDCQPDPCLNGGTCVDGLRSYTCTCVDGYSGRNCSIDHPDCSPNPCVDNATCLERSIKHLYGIPSLPAPFNGHFRYSLAAGFVCDKGHADELPPDSNSGMGIGIAVGFAICSVLAVAIFLLVLWGYKQRKLSLGFFSRMDSKYAANDENSHSHVAETHIDGLRSTEMLHSVGSSANRNGVAVANDRETYVDMSQNVRSDISSDYVRPSELGRHMSSVYISPTSAEALGTGNARATQDETYEMPNANVNQPTIELFATVGANSAQSQSTALPAVDEEGAESDGSDKIYTMADVSPGEQRIDASKDSKMEKKSSSKEKPKCSLESTLATAGSLPSLSAAAGTSTLGAGEPQAPQQRLAVSQTEPNLQFNSELHATDAYNLPTDSSPQLSSNPPSTKPRKPAKPANWRQQQQPPARPTRSPGSENSQQQQPSSTGTTSTETAEAAGTQAVENAETVYDTIEYGSFEGSIPQQQSQQARTALPAKIDPTKLGSFEKFK